MLYNDLCYIAFKRDQPAKPVAMLYNGSQCCTTGRNAVQRVAILYNEVAILYNGSQCCTTKVAILYNGSQCCTTKSQYCTTKSQYITTDIERLWVFRQVSFVKFV